jgi:hypothetical protein
MRAVRLLLAGVVGALSLVVLGAAPSFACSCALAGTEQYVDVADAVFTGTVTDKEPPPKRPMMSSMDPVTYTFDVERAFKGDLSDPLPVLSAMSGASCGLEGVRVGQRYVVFASESKRGEHDLWASLCGGTAPWSAGLEADVVAATGPGTPPEVGADPPEDVAAGSVDEPEAAEGGSLAVPVAAASGLALVLLGAVL